ncbi:integral membrane transferase [Actinoplanes sp. OR16]|uniref:acyltransferase family protein n=1 Tax=Actinoplanes sp. OR16 TaxID=946334 RepID=UPI000F6BC458|nr:acyltransferase [Actinoplanes sp. OR16]BBH69027.1 integral membrane transferase [Actinoplanes sp. OR16]
MAETRPARRDRYFDLLRVLAIVRVSVFHMFPYALLELVFPSMGVMFALAGSLMANSLQRSPSVMTVIRGRLRRLLPAYWLLAVVLVPAMFLVGWEERPPLWHLIAWIVPFVDPPTSGFGMQATEVLWYLVTYLWLVTLSPILLWLYRRMRLVAIVAPVVVLLVLSVHPIWPANENYQEVATNILMYASCWMLGFAHRDGSLKRIPGLLVTVLAAVLVTAGLAWSWQHPDAGGIKEIPVAYAVYNAGFVLFLLRWSPSMEWLTKRRFLDGWVTLINARAVTIYLWNNVAIALCFPVGDALEVWRLGGLFEIGYVVVALALLVNAVLFFGWVEDVAARKRARFLPWPVGSTEPVAGEPAKSQPDLTATVVAPMPLRPVPARATAPGAPHGRAAVPVRH